MKYTFEVETNDDFKSCDDCIHGEDVTELCVLRRCVHAIPKLFEGYKPKQTWETLPFTINKTTTCPSVCAGCSNNPANGGSGICHCTLGTPQIT